VSKLCHFLAYLINYILLCSMFTGGYYDVKSQEKLMKLLRKHVNKLYKTCIGANDAHLSSILMLTSIEKNFEDVVRDLDTIPQEVVLKISRVMIRNQNYPARASNYFLEINSVFMQGLEKERREAERREQESLRNKHRVERVSKSLERATAPIKLRVLA